MPELPEVETTLQGIKPHLINQKIVNIAIRHARLRWPIPQNLGVLLKNQKLIELKRRGKYLLFSFKKGTLILHLGMSGHLRILKEPTPPRKHDHVDIDFANGVCLRFRDTRRFGALLWTTNPTEHPLLAHLGVEPLTTEFNGDYLYERAQKRKVPVKVFIMNGKIVVGVGNIYATEALFEAKLLPQREAGKISRQEYHALAKAIKKVLARAIEKGGTSLKDFKKSDGTLGHFSQRLKAYGRGGKKCPRCQGVLKAEFLGQRNTAYCPSCQR